MSKRFSRIILLLLLLGGVISALMLRRITFTYEYERFFPPDDPDLEFFLTFREIFGNDTDFMLLGLENKKGIFDSTFLHKVNQLTNDIEDAEYIEWVQSPTTLKYALFTPLGPVQVPYMHTEQPEKYTSDSTTIYNDPLLPGTLVAENGKSVALYIKAVPGLQKEARDSLTNSLTALIESQNFDNYHLVGRIVAETYYVNQLEKEVVILFGTTAVLLIIFLIIAFRSWWGVLVPLAVVFFAVLGTMGIIGGLGQEVDVLVVLLPTIIFIVGMSDVVHILTKYIEELRNGSDKMTAIKTTVKEVGLATLMTSLTTSIGFFSLMTSSTIPIKNFGLFAAIGVILAFVVAFTMLPSMLVNLGTPKLADKAGNHFMWQNLLKRIFRLTFRNKSRIMMVYSGIVVLAIIGIFRIKANTSLLEEISDRNPFKQSFIYMEEEFGGVRPFEMAIQMKDSVSVFDPKVLTEINKVEMFIRDSFDIRNIISPVVIVKSLNKALHGGDPKAFQLPENEKDWAKLNRKLKLTQKLSAGRAFVSEDGFTGRISGKTTDIGSLEAERRRGVIYTFIENNINTDLIDFRITGSAYLVDKNSQELSFQMIEGLSIAFVIISILMGFLYRSLRIVLIALIPNVIPLMIIGAFIGYIGISFNMSSSIIFSIAFGIAVDDTIHFMSRLKLELMKGKSLLYAIKRTYLSTGKAIMITSFILSAGFLTLTISVFNGTFYIGILVCITLVVALVADLTLLPVLLLLFYSVKRKK